MEREAQAGEAPARRDPPDRDRVRGSVCRPTHAGRSDDLLAPVHDERGLTALVRPRSSVRFLELVTTLEVSEAADQPLAGAVRQSGAAHLVPTFARWLVSWSRAAGSRFRSMRPQSRPTKYLADKESEVLGRAELVDAAFSKERPAARTASVVARGCAP